MTTNRTLRRFVPGALMVVSLVSTASAQQSRTEFWPELNVYWRMNAITRLYFFAAPTISRQEEYGENQLGANVEFGVAPILRREFRETYDIDRFRFLRFRVGFSYGSNLKWSNDEYTEWRGILELTPRVLLPGEFLVAMRNRVDLRWLNSNSSWRFRPRLAVERETAVTDWLTIVPFGMLELFYDSRYAAWNRVQVAAGVGVPVVGPFLLEASYYYQHDTRSQPTYVHAFDLALNFFF